MTAFEMFVNVNPVFDIMRVQQENKRFYTVEPNGRLVMVTLKKEFDSEYSLIDVIAVILQEVGIDKADELINASDSKFIDYVFIDMMKNIEVDENCLQD